MSREASTVKFISYGLAIVYLLSFLVYIQGIIVPEYRVNAVVLSLFFLVLAAAAVVAAQLKDQARQVLVIGNAVLFIFLGVLFIAQRQAVIPVGYLFFTVVSALFYSQESTRMHFAGKSGGNRKSVLIVDDDPALLKIIKPVLLASGYSVLTAMSGEKGLQIVKRQKPDLVILDVILPGIKGRQMCMKIKEDPQTQKIPVIFLTAKDSPDDVKAELAAGAIAHITKPFTPQRLLEEIRKAIG